MKVLVTGGAGFIGQRVVSSLIGAGHDVTVFDNLHPQVHESPRRSADAVRATGATMVEGDVRDMNRWVSLLPGPETVVHLAAETGVGQSMYDARTHVDVNVGGTASLIDRITALPLTERPRRVVVSSSRAVYGEGAYRCPACGVVSPAPRTLAELDAGRWDAPCPRCAGAIRPVPTSEEHPRDVRSVYAATKAAQEDLISLCGAGTGVGTTVLRFTNVYGEGQSLHNPYTGVLTVFANAAMQGDFVPLYEDGAITRDFVHVDDVAAAVHSAVESGVDGTFNVGAGAAVGLRRVAELLIAALASSSSIKVTGQYRVGDIRHFETSTDRIADQLGHRSCVSLDEGIGRFAAWAASQRPFRHDRADDELARFGLLRQAGS